MSKKKAMSSELKAGIRKVIVFVITIVALAAAGFGLTKLAQALKVEEEEKIVLPRNYEGEEEIIVLENDSLKLELDSMTTQFTITNKKTGYVWYSNPVDVDSDTLALPAEKNKLKSTVHLTYSTMNGVDTLFDNYGYGTEGHMYEIEKGDDYIKILYSIGKAEREYIIPPVIQKDRMEAYLAVMDKNASTKIKDYYKVYNINKLGKKDNKEELLERFPILETEIVYVLRDGQSNNIKGMLEKAFAGAGYTQEEYDEDKLLDTSVSVSDKPVFNMSVVYRLDGDDFIAEVPLSEIEYRDGYPVYNISILPYFGAGGKNNTGYALIPEAGGAIINFNNGKVSQNAYYSNLYGWDEAIERKALVHDTRAGFNAFGLSKDGESFVCIIEGCAPYAAIRAGVSGKTNSFNTAYAEYNVIHRNQYDIGSRTTAAIFVYEDEIPNETIVQRYRFVSDDSYVSMAKSYGEYLEEKYSGYLTENTDTSTPVAVEILGAVDKIKQVFGVPVSRPLKLTSYAEAVDIVTDLKNSGFDNMSVKLTGMINDGVRQDLLKDVDAVSELGSEKELRALATEIKNLGADVYLNGVTNYTYDSNFFDGFIAFRDSAKFVSKKTVELYPYNTVSFEQMKARDSHYLLKGSLVLEMADNLVAAANDFGMSTSFEDYGYKLSADYNKKELVTRQAMMLKQAEQLKLYKDASNKIMINEGNDYAIGYVDFVTSMDIHGYRYSVIDQMVPFYQLAIHGLVNYTGESLNITQDYEEELLKSAECGAGLSFTFMHETAFELQSTYYTKYFGAEYNAWKDKAVEIYTRYNKELGHIFNQRMVNHESVGNNLTCTTYEDGTRVYVNYNHMEATAADGTVVPARDYKVTR